MGEYQKLSSDDLQQKLTKMVELWESFLDHVKSFYVDQFQKESSILLAKKKTNELYNVNLFALREVFERTHQREDYFDRYHDRLKMSDFKEIGLIAFWITKFKPFHLNADIFSEAYALRINEEFALYFIFNSIANYTVEQNQEYRINQINSELYNEILYTMQYRDLSKEAFGCIVELIYLAMVVN